MNSLKLFIPLSPRIRKQLEIAGEKEEYSYYEVLGLNHDFTPDDVERKLNRSRELLERLKFHPQHKEEARNAFEILLDAARILQNPETRASYDARLEESRQEGKNRRTEIYRRLIEITSREQTLGQKQIKPLLGYALEWNIDPGEAQAIIETFSSKDRDSPLLIASLPRVSAPIHRFTETQAFQIILRKAQGVASKLSILKCSSCGRENPVTILLCSCGSIMRGKMICAGCARLFSITDSQCPICGNDSQVMLELTDEDIQNLHNHVHSRINQEENESAMKTCRDILEVLPGDHRIKAVLEEMRSENLSLQAAREGRDMEKRGMKAWEEKNVYSSYHLLTRASRLVDLCGESREVLEKSSETLKTRLNRVSLILLGLSSALVLFSIIYFRFIANQDRSWEKVTAFGFLLLLCVSICFRLYFTRVLRKTLENSSVSKSSQGQDSS